MTKDPRLETMDMRDLLVLELKRSAVKVWAGPPPQKLQVTIIPGLVYSWRLLATPSDH